MNADGQTTPLGAIGGIGLTLVHVYDQRPDPDGGHGGSPHMHAVTDEAYYVVRGSGRVELHDVRHGMRVIDLMPGLYLDFEPCILHRLVNTGGLEILGMMGNAGLAEAGDARIYFGPETRQHPERLEHLMGLPRSAGLEGALDRRDAALRDYAGLVKLWETDRAAYFSELSSFTRHCLEHAAALRSAWTEVVRSGPLAWGRRTEARLAALPGAVTDYSCRAAPDQPGPHGMCGVLSPVRPE